MIYLQYLLIGICTFGLIESIRRTWQMIQDLQNPKEIALVFVLNVLTFGMIGYIIDLGCKYYRG